jgi:hypothetical protein
LIDSFIQQDGLISLEEFNLEGEQVTGSRSIRGCYETAAGGLFGDIGLRKRVGASNEGCIWKY